MSRIGKLPISIPAGVTVSMNNGVVTVKGPKGELSQIIKSLSRLTRTAQLTTSRSRLSTVCIVHL